MSSEPSTRDRYRGALLGLAAGDALGTTLEFRSPGSFAPIDGIVGGGPFGLQAGEWTDDTSMALCLAESLIECGALGSRPLAELPRSLPAGGEPGERRRHHRRDHRPARRGAVGGRGRSGDPEEWVAILAMRERIEELADALLGLAER